MKTLIPFFPGFYESLLSNVIDQEMDMRLEENENWDESTFDYRVAMLAVAQGWLSYFSDTSGIPLTFIELDSPREYNFETDKIIADIPTETLQSFYSKIKGEWKKEFSEVLENHFTHRSGFMSFYSPDPLEWDKPLEAWNEVELFALVKTAIIAQEIEIESCPDEPCVYEAADAGYR